MNESTVKHVTSKPQAEYTAYLKFPEQGREAITHDGKIVGFRPVKKQGNKPY